MKETVRRVASILALIYLEKGQGSGKIDCRVTEI